MKINNKIIKISKKTFLRKPSKVMKLNRLGSFHQTRLSFLQEPQHRGILKTHPPIGHNTNDNH